MTVAFSRQAAFAEFGDEIQDFHLAGLSIGFGLKYAHDEVEFSLHQRKNPRAESRRRGADFRRRVHRARNRGLNNGISLH